MKSRHIMLDLETLSSREDAAILSIGAIRFDLDTFEVAPKIVFPYQSEEPRYPAFYSVVDASECHSKFGMRVDVETVKWWLDQSDKAKEPFREEGRSLPHVLQDFSYFVSAIQESVIWGNGSTFDNMILRNAYRAAGHIYPVNYKSDLCYRTIRNLFPIDWPNEVVGIQHNALDDAISQAGKFVETMRRIKTGSMFLKEQP